MKHLYTFILLTTLLFPLHAQLNGDGFYRVQNVRTKRFVSVIDNRGSIDKASMNADLGAIVTYKGFARVATDPGSIIYLKQVNGEYDLIAQGTSVSGIVGITVQILDKGNGIYNCYKSASGFAARYLTDLNNLSREVGRVLTSDNIKSGTEQWYIWPIKDEAERYLAVQPTIQKGESYYTTCYASYGFSFLNDEDQAFYITTVDDSVAVYKEIVGMVPPATPVIIRGISNVVEDHKITPYLTTLTAVSDNKLTGTYFCSSVEGHVNRVKNDATIRVLGILSDGSLGFKRDTELDYVPQNTAYLKVAENAPDEIKLVTEQEYEEQQRLKTPVTLTAVNITREYGESNPALTYAIDGTLLGGEPVLSCEATADSPVGTYLITIEKGNVTNLTPTLVSGTLTITPAPLTVKVGSYTRKYGEDNPVFEVTYEGWKNGDDIYQLTSKAVVKTEAGAASPVGEYDIILSDAASPNYTFDYQSGTLTITPVTLTATVGSYQREYGDANPNFEVVYDGWCNGDTPDCLTEKPVVQTEADKSSDVGTYSLVLSGGQSQNYQFQYSHGTLTVTKAPLTISAADYDYTRERGEENPDISEIKLTYTGFKNDDTPESLTKQPEITIEADKDSPEGTYPIIVSGAESPNYEITYVDGALLVLPPIGIRDVKAAQNADVYSLMGTRVRQDGTMKTPLKRGFYVINGRKVLVK